MYMTTAARSSPCNLRQWNVQTGWMIGTSVGDDTCSAITSKTNLAKPWACLGKVRFTNKYKTPLEVNISDKNSAAARIFWQRSPEILSTPRYGGFVHV